MSTSNSGKGRGITKAPDPCDDSQEMPSPSHSNESQMRGNATEHAKHLLPDQEDDAMEKHMFKLNDFLTEVVLEMYPFLSGLFDLDKTDIEDMIFAKTLDWLENPREDASYSNSELEVHDKLWSVMKTDKNGAPKEHSFVEWCRKIALLRNNAANNAATKHADRFRILVKDIVANNLTPAQRKKKKYKLREGASIPSELRSLVNVILRKNLGDAKVASYIFKCGIPTVLDADLLKHPLQHANMETLLEELLRWHASLLQWLDERQNHPHTIIARKLSDPNEKDWQAWRRRRKLALKQQLRKGAFLANLRDTNVKRARDMSAIDQRVLKDYDTGKLRKCLDDGVRIRKPK